MNVLQLVGNTPLLQLDESVYAKAEFLNPSGSIKDRMVKFMLEAAEERKELKKGNAIIEATSGNTGISLAMIAPLKGFKAKIFMPEEMSIERKKIMRGFGAELALTKDMEEAKEKARAAAKEDGHFYLNQFENPDNILAHYLTTGKEILQQTNAKIDAFVAGIGTGGTVIGVGKLLRERFPNVKLFGFRPKDEKNAIEGIGCYYSKKLVDESFLDDIIEVSNKDAINAAKQLMREKGLFVGISSGANYFAAKQLQGKVVTVLPDSANRYLSTELFK